MFCAGGFSVRIDPRMMLVTSRLERTQGCCSLVTCQLEELQNGAACWSRFNEKEFKNGAVAGHFPVRENPRVMLL